MAGEKGVPGDRGTPGKQGPKGDSGKSGLDGERGLQGNHGTDGSGGERGVQGEDGPEGRGGERGESGDRGVTGERGPKGDHGQEGHEGVQGRRGERGERGTDAPPPITRRLAIILAVLLTAGYTGISWSVDRNSCQRQGDVRTAARIFSKSAKEARLDSAANYRDRGDNVQARINEKAAVAFDKSLRLSQPLDCSGVFPDK